MTRARRTTRASNTLAGADFSVPHPFRDRSVRVIAVPCPVCHAAIGAPCLNENGERTHHSPRRAMALRAERKAAGS